MELSRNSLGINTTILSWTLCESVLTRREWVARERSVIAGGIAESQSNPQAEPELPSELERARARQRRIDARREAEREEMRRLQQSVQDAAQSARQTRDVREGRAPAAAQNSSDGPGNPNETRRIEL